MAGRGKWYALILLLVVAVPVVVLTLVLDLSRPVFPSVDDVDPGDVERLEVRLFNVREALPPPPEGESYPDALGPFDARHEDVSVLLGLLQGAKPVDRMPA